MTKFKTLALAALAAGLTLGSIQSTRAAEDEVTYQPFTFGAGVGTLGFGVSAGWRFSDHFGANAGVNFFSFSQDGNDIEGVSYNTKLRLLSQPVGLDIYPWKDRSFHFTVGVLINQNRLTGDLPDPGVPGSRVDIGNNNYDISIDLRGATVKVEQQTVSPYLSIGGNFFIDQARRWSIAGELGVAYTGSPDATITIANPTTALNAGFIADKDAEERQIEDKLSDYKFYPIVKLSVNFSF